MAAIVGATCLMGAQAHIAIVQQTPTLPGHPSMAQYKPSIDLTRFDLKGERGGIKTYASKSQLHQKRYNASPGQTVTVTCNIVGDANKFRPDYGTHVTLLNSDSNLDYWTEVFGSHRVVCADVPVGTYDIITSAVSQGEPYGFLHYIIREQVNITSDTTIVLDLDEATNRVEANMLKPDGTLCTFPLIDLSTNEIIEEGNISSMFLNFDLYSNEANDMAAGYFITNGQSFVGLDILNCFYINNVSGRFKVIGHCIARDNNMTDYMMVHSKDGIDGDFTFVNDPADYVLYQEQFQPTPAYNPEEGGGATAFRLGATYNGVMYGSVDSWSDRFAPNGLTSFYLDAPDREDNSIQMLFYPGFVDKRNIKSLEYGGYEDEEGVWHETVDTVYSRLIIYGQGAVVSKNGVEYVNSGHDIAGNNAFHMSEDSNADIIDYPGNPHFAFTDRQKALAYGTGCPINAVMARNIDLDREKYSYLDFAYLGRYGEFRGSDLDCATLKITYNQDSVICTDLAEVYQSLDNLAMEHKFGQIDADVVNTNVEVDGLPGKNRTHVFYDWSLEDWTAPTLQMLWLRDSEGNIIDRFASGDEGVLEFAGGDFNFHLTDRIWFDCQPQTVEVSYSPYDADSWEPFAVEEVPENFFMPGFGYFYRGELSQVEGNGEKGWFDLKIKLTDLSGNWQEQVISPAFRIDDHAYSSVANVGKDNAHEVARYTLDGRRISTPQPGINIVRYSDGTARKVLVAQ